jgi:hypothetical protein
MTTQKKNTMMPGTLRPAMVLALATAVSYPPYRGLFGEWFRAILAPDSCGGAAARISRTRSGARLRCARPDPGR